MKLTFCVVVDDVLKHACTSREFALFHFLNMKKVYRNSSIRVYSVVEITDNPHFLHCLDDESEE